MNFLLGASGEAVHGGSAALGSVCEGRAVCVAGVSVVAGEDDQHVLQSGRTQEDQGQHEQRLLALQAVNPRPHEFSSFIYTFDDPITIELP